MTYLSHQSEEGTSQMSRRLAEEICTYVSKHSEGIKETKEDDVDQLNGTGTLRRVVHTGLYLVLTVLVLSTVVVGGGILHTHQF